MKKLLLIQIGLFSICLLGCAGGSSNTAANTNAVRTPLPTATPVTKGTEQQGNYVNTKPANLPPTNSYADSNMPTKSANSAGNSRIKVTTVNSSGNTGQSNSKPTSTPPTEKAEKKDEGLFSFPPPKVTDVAVISASEFLSREGTTTLAQVSGKLSDGLEKAGYKRGKYKYFWNEQDEFAVVTAMERVNADGSNFVEDRWVEDEDLPRAQSFIEYFRYLIEGKKVFYRVFAFVITARRDEDSFNDGSPPEFTTALNWRDKGKSKLGDGETTTVESAVFTPRHQCFALVYLFVNHTSLDLPKSVDALNKYERRLQEDLVKEADVHINKTNLHFGG